MRWYSMSVGFLQDPKVEQLGEKHGPAGPLVVVDLFSAAALAEGGGRLSRSYRTIANNVFIDRNQAEKIVISIIETGLCHEVSRDVTGVELTFPAWKRWQATGRQAKSRAARKATSQADVTDGHDLSRDVTTDRQTDSTNRQGASPFSPSPGAEDNPNLSEQVWSILKGGVDSLAENDHGRPWPDPSLGKLALAIGATEPEVALKVAREVREIVQSQDRAPNVTALYEQRLKGAA